MILSLDIGIANCGYAIGDTGNLVDSGTYYTKANVDFELRKRAVITFIGEKLELFDITLVLIERVRAYGRYMGIHKTIELVGALKENLYQKGIEYVEIPYSKWKSKHKEIPEEILHGYIMSKGSQHEKDAVGMLAAYLFTDLKEELS